MIGPLDEGFRTSLSDASEVSIFDLFWRGLSRDKRCLHTEDLSVCVSSVTQ